METIPETSLIIQILHCVLSLAAVIVPCALILVILDRSVKVPRFIFRKLMHTVAFSSVCVMLCRAESWEAVSITMVLAAAASWPVLSALEKTSWYSPLLTEKSPGEVRKSLAMFFVLIACLAALSWGVLKDRFSPVTAVLMWGTGDAAAALLGIPFGKHKVRFGASAGKKSREGSFAMLAVSFIFGCASLCIIHGQDLSKALIPAFTAALAGTAAELFSPGELDTVTVPSAVFVVLQIFFRSGLV